MKPRIFIHMHYLEIGGAETALIGLLQALDPARVEVDLFLDAHRGEMMRFVPEWVNVLPEVPAYAAIESPMVVAARRGCIGVVVARLWAKVLYGLYARRQHPTDGSAIFGYVGRCVTPVLPSLKRFGEYDLAISFLTPHNIVLDKVRAKRKVCWIHTDYTRIDTARRLELPVWDGYDRIVSISPDVTRTFCTVFPTLRPKIIEISNILSPSFIRQRASATPRPADMPPRDKCLTLLTIGRFSPPKKIDEIPAICRHLVAGGCAVVWYIIGYGGSDAYIRRAIAQEGMERHVILLGKRDNPYPYIKACDWYVQPSRYEGQAVVVREAQVLGRPVIITAYPTAASQVQDGVDGVIVPLPVRECAAAMSAALRDEALRRRIVAHLATHDYGNVGEAERVYELFEEL